MQPAARQRLGRYEVLDLLGEGSMGVVYLARDPLIGRLIALKTLQNGSTRSATELESLRLQFINEAQSAGGLSHPGIVTIHDLVDDPEDGSLYIAMEYVEGVSLAQILKGPEPISLELVDRVVSGVAEILDYAHAQDVVHRDIKPANLMLAESGEVKVTDFGIAHVRRQGLAADLKLLGTPNYLAPERILGEEVDHRSDVYSLGVVLYQLLTRRLPFQAETISELTRSIALDDYTPPEKFVPGISPGLRAVVAKALSRDPEYRYQSAGELAAELRQVLAQQARLSDTVPTRSFTPLAPEVATLSKESADLQPGFAQRLGEARSLVVARWPLSLSRRRLAAGGAALLALVLLVMVIVGARSGSTAADPAEAVEPQGDDERGRELRYLALLGEGQELLARGDNAAAERVLGAAQEAAVDPARARRLRAQARRAAELRPWVDRQLEASEFVEVAKEALATGRLRDARSAIEHSLALDGEHREALLVASQVAAAQRRFQASSSRASQQPTTPAVVRVAPPRPKPRPVVTKPPVAVVVPQFGTLEIDFASIVSKGVLTIYSGETQLFRQAFRFVEKKGFLRSRKVSGGFEESLRLTSGENTLRVYLAIPGQATQSTVVAARVPGGGAVTLRLRVDGDGVLGTEVVER